MPSRPRFTSSLIQALPPLRGRSPERSEHAVAGRIGGTGTIARRRAQRITVIAVGTPPPLPLRPFAMEVLRVLEANQAAEREAKQR